MIFFSRRFCLLTWDYIVLTASTSWSDWKDLTDKLGVRIVIFYVKQTQSVSNGSILKGVKPEVQSYIYKVKFKS